MELTSPPADLSTAALLASANTFTAAPQQITIDTNTDKGLIIKGAASQSGNYLHIQNSADAAVFTVLSTGGIEFRSTMAIYFGDSSAGGIGRINSDGNFTFFGSNGGDPAAKSAVGSARWFEAVPNSAPTDAHLWANSISWYINQADNTLRARVLYSDGTTYKSITTPIPLS